MGKLEEQIQNLIEEDFVTETMRIPAAKYEGVAFLHREANILEKKYVGSDIELTFSISEPDLKRLQSLLDNIDTAESVVE
jgi:GTP-binding protein HflX